MLRCQGRNARLHVRNRRSRREVRLSFLFLHWSYVLYARAPGLGMNVERQLFEG